MFYSVCAQVTYTEGRWTGSIQVPTFILNGDIQGITDIDHASRIAEKIVNPTGDSGIRVAVCVETLYQ